MPSLPEVGAAVGLLPRDCCLHCCGAAAGCCCCVGANLGHLPVPSCCRPRRWRALCWRCCLPWVATLSSRTACCACWLRQVGGWAGWGHAVPAAARCRLAAVPSPALHLTIPLSPRCRPCTEHGQEALRRAVVALHAAAAGAEQPAGPPSTVAVATAAQWVATRCVSLGSLAAGALPFQRCCCASAATGCNNAAHPPHRRYWGHAERLGGGGGGAGAEGLRTALSDVVTVMQQICVGAGGGARPPPPAPQRFVAALQVGLGGEAVGHVCVCGCTLAPCLSRLTLPLLRVPPSGGAARGCRGRPRRGTRRAPLAGALRRRGAGRRPGL